jgi:hypothetical protein
MSLRSVTFEILRKTKICEIHFKINLAPKHTAYDTLHDFWVTE